MRRAHFLVLAAPLLASVLWILLSIPAHAQNPDYSDTPDMLHGQNYLRRDDDIVLVQNNGPSRRTSRGKPIPISMRC